MAPILQKLDRYFGTSHYLALFIISFAILAYIVFIWFKKYKSEQIKKCENIDYAKEQKDKSKVKEQQNKQNIEASIYCNKKVITILCLILPALGIIILLNPITYKVLNPFVEQGDDYWRFFWLIPIGIVVATCFTFIIQKKESKIYKIITSIVLILILYICGKFVYNKNNFQKVDNSYKMPDLMLEAIQAISNSENEQTKKVMSVSGAVAFIRQYDGTLKLAYVRSPSGYPEYIQNFDNGIIDYQIEDFILKECNYLIVNNIYNDCNFESYGYYNIFENDKYIVYENLDIDYYKELILQKREEQALEQLQENEDLTSDELDQVIDGILDVEDDL